ncbi:MAG: glycoside hydrolase family 5 protein [Oscillospiraceae bacterium]|nr:glycoside hydrolase family 5 protein [Oscillospiraceae bacterium]
MKELTGFKKGVDLGGWMSQCDYSKEVLDGYITEDDFKKIASWGLDHVRLPIDYNILENEDGTYKEDGFDRVEKAVNTAIANGLNIIIDIHKTAGFSFDAGEHESGFFVNKAYRDRFIRLWEQIAERFARYDGHIVFELLNEVTDREYIGVWNECAEECITAIRKKAPSVPVLVGSYWNNSAEAVKDLDAPHDENVYYNFHCYEPLVFTHQGATWTDLIDPEKRVGFDELDITEEYFEKLFASAIEHAEKNGTGLYCGEYGVIDRVSPEDTLKWYKTINSVFRRHNIGRAAWNYRRKDFGLTDERLSGIIDELVKYL